MRAPFVLTAILLFILVTFSAFFSASETAFTSLTKAKRRQIRKSGNKQDRTLARILSNPARMLTTILIGNNIANIWSSSLATAFAISLFGSTGIGIATIVMTIIILVFSEITPKTLAANKPEPLIRAFTPAIDLCQRLLFPLVVFFSLINDLFITILKRLSPDQTHLLTEDELKTMMAVGRDEGVLEEGEHRLLNRAFDFSDLKLREIMTPRTDIVAVRIDSSIEEIRETFRKSRVSRLPVYENSLDSIKGMIHYKDVLFRPNPVTSDGIMDIVRTVLFVPETQTTYELLQEMERNNQNLAIVIDEHGATAGLVTINDAITTVFGGIRDECDEYETAPAEKVQFISENLLTVPGRLKLDDLNALIKTELDSGYFETVGGFVLEQAGRLPVRGESIRYGNLIFRIEELSGRRISRIGIILENEG